MTLYENTALSAPDTGDWFQVARDGREQIVAVLSITAGTATVELQGRVEPSDTPVVIRSDSADFGALVARFPQMRVNVTSAAAADLRVSLDATGWSTV